MSNDDRYKDASCELDEPILSDDSGGQDFYIPDQNRMTSIEARVNGQHVRRLQDKGYRLLIIMVIAVGTLYTTDTVLSACGLTQSLLTSPIFDLFKYITSTLVGFVFAKLL